ncbi:hypothetical protein RCL_jg18531.t1 [Rhizophagus clarus]|uniref:Uncharacterized protein n=1 Tax=Rhizophagus clarus TaxID=94130 RepID=A0A8H3QP89_9GLOM|nr:hypothetical protein RCL_jg18531.t1 [Rhizophagus clarus]
MIKKFKITKNFTLDNNEDSDELIIEELIKKYWKKFSEKALSIWDKNDDEFTEKLNKWLTGINEGHDEFDKLKLLIWMKSEEITKDKIILEYRRLNYEINPFNEEEYEDEVKENLYNFIIELQLQIKMVTVSHVNISGIPLEKDSESSSLNINLQDLEEFEDFKEDFRNLFRTPSPNVTNLDPANPAGADTLGNKVNGIRDGINNINAPD